MNLRRAAKVDANQPDIVKALRKLGAVVIHLGHPVDLLVGLSGRWLPVEIKDPSQPPSKRELTDDQQAVFSLARQHNLPIAKCETVEDVLLAFRIWA